MAKTKEKVVELKPKAEKISDNHLKQLQEVVNKINGIQFNIGKMEMQKHAALHELKNAQDEVSVLQNTLVKEYGTYDVNLNDGTINWPEVSPNGVDKPQEDEK